MTVTFMARGIDVKPGPRKSYTGHTFMVLSVTTDKGTSSAAYGFYPRDNGVGMIKGPGMLKSEFRCSSQECIALEASAKGVSDSVSIPISSTEWNSVLKLVDDYNGPKLWGPSQPAPEYFLTSENCNRFVGRIANELGYPSPPPGLLPTQYLAKLKALVETEQNRRSEEMRKEAERVARLEEERREREERRRVEAEERARQEQRRRQEAEARRRQQEEANRIPNGWVRCGCPDRHTGYGKVVNGTRWHDSNVGNCP